MNSNPHMTNRRVSRFPGKNEIRVEVEQELQFKTDDLHSIDAEKAKRRKLDFLFRNSSQRSRERQTV